MKTARTKVTLSAIACVAFASSACQQGATNNTETTSGNAAGSIDAAEPANSTARSSASNATASAPAMTEAERAAYMQRHGVGFTAVDANSDGRVTLEESGAYARSTLGGGDTDGDGAISAAEMARVNPNVRAVLLRADADRDGAISSAEFDAHVARRFTVLDANRDGGVTEAEMRAAPPSS